MCNTATLDWLARNLNAADIGGRRVLEVGSYDVNGSVRPLIERQHPAEYIGTDMRPGPGVDVVCQAEHLVERFGPQRFDIVVTSSTLEHIRHWKPAVSQMKQVCAPGGLILVIVPAQWPFHAYPHDYWRYTASDLQHIFGDMHVLVVEEEHASQALAYMKAQKPAQYAERDLTDYELYSMIAGRRVRDICRRDMLSAHFAWVLFGYSLQYVPPRLARLLVFLVMGVRIKLIDPLRRGWHSARGTDA